MYWLWCFFSTFVGITSFMWISLILNYFLRAAESEEETTVRVIWLKKRNVIKVRLRQTGLFFVSPLKYNLRKLCRVMYFLYTVLSCIKFKFVTTFMYITPMITKNETLYLTLWNYNMCQHSTMMKIRVKQTPWPLFTLEPNSFSCFSVIILAPTQAFLHTFQAWAFIFYF